MNVLQRKNAAGGPGRRQAGTGTSSPRRVLHELEGLLSRFGDGGFAVGPAERILLWNSGAEWILGYAAREVIGRRRSEVFGGQDAPDGWPCERLHVSLATVRNHVQGIFRKLGVHSRLAAVAHAHRDRLL